MVNPFRYGKAITGEYFCNRTREIQELTSCIEAAQNIFIYSNRRLGKTSLIKVVMEALAGEVISVYVDVHRTSSAAQFLEVYSKAISQAFLTRKEKIEKIANFFTRIIPSFEVEKDGSWRVSFDFSRTKVAVERALEEILLSQNELFYSWHDFCSPHQRAVLGALVKANEIFSQDNRLLYNLGSSASVQTSLRALMKNGLVTKDDSKYHIVDPFFQLWLRRNVAI